jgi:hypothetical protein
MKKIQDIIETLSPEEKEKFKELIEECETREKELISSREKISSSIEMLVKSVEGTCNALCDIEKSVATLKDELKAIEVFSNSNLGKGDLN